jgi:hypothetical protein
MTDREFDVLDELYFVTSYHMLQENTGLMDEVLYPTIVSLLEQGWIKILRTMDDEVQFIRDDFSVNYKTYNYLATKAGLLAHNGR